MKESREAVELLHASEDSSVRGLQANQLADCGGDVNGSSVSCIAPLAFSTTTWGYCASFDVPPDCRVGSPSRSEKSNSGRRESLLADGTVEVSSCTEALMPLKTGRYDNLHLRSPGQSVGKRVQVRRGMRTTD